MYATVEDLRLRWPDCRLSDEQATVMLEDASTWLAVSYPAIGSAPVDPVAQVVRLIACSMVKRAAMAETYQIEGVTSATDTSGPFSDQRVFANPQGNYFITAQERATLEAALSSAAVAGIRCIEAVGW